ncbi:L,D-transpeptidase [Paenibacillus lemnae]|uniref:L,D-transpeptidase n=1 Tax=Paenibacillus lemnae TaxID=1330551 RepID=A0A848M3B5_PAELE|nr:L,D-transpeptidase [Paenibacillus lemnae]NMO94731.1 L,D-transpeptidase [Paenibacillus lemnae]
MPKYRIIVDLSNFRLYLLDGDQVEREFPIAVGKMATQTPPGNYTIVNKEPNPGGPYGSYWLGLSKPHYGIHGTNNPASIGRAVSRGCIRMYNEDVNLLASLVPIHTQVTIRP